MKSIYIFKSKRLGFRNWTIDDLDSFAEMNQDIRVMEYFPNILTKLETQEFIDRLLEHYNKHGYNYFATEKLTTGEFIGFIGLAYQNYETEFTPATDIGWRLKKSVWNKGYATEGAKRCLKFAFTDLNIKKIISTCSKYNTKSENVMKKIGMIKKGEFHHPKLKNHPSLEKYICYEIKKERKVL